MKKIFTLLLSLVTLASFSQSTTLVVSQVYGAGGNTGALYNADYVELHNVSASAINLSGYSIQYSAATSTTWSSVYALPAQSVPAGGYYLILMSTVGTVGAALPTPDATATPSIAMAAASGKIALVNGTTALTACTGASIVDLVGYGSSNCSETSPTAVLSATLAAIRNNNGCTDTDNNSTDFSVVAPAPRNSASPVQTCAGGPPSPAITAGTIADFGNVVILTNSPSVSFNVSGSNLTGAPGTITITAPSTEFQVSNNNTTWGASTTIPFTSATLSATPVWVRFTPQSVGLKTGNITITGGGIASPVLVAVRGTGINAAGPSLSAGTLTSFGNVCINNTGGPTAVSVSGSNLTTANVVIGPLNGFSFSNNAGGPFTSTLTITQPGGSLNSNVFVTFNPTLVQSYNGTIPVSGGGATAININATGSGVNTGATLTTGSASAITFTTATLAGGITSSGCSPVTTYGIAYSTVNGFATGTMVNATNLSGGIFSSNVTGLSAGTTYYYKSFAINAGGTTYGPQLSFNTAAATLNISSLSDFGDVCVLTTAGPNSFTLSSPNISPADITVGPLNGYTFSTTATGTFTPVLTITQPGGAFNQDVFVIFTPATAGSFNGMIPVSGGGAGALQVAVTGSGADIPAEVSTAPVPPVLISPRSVRLFGSIDVPGCGAILEYGIIYSGINGFPVNMGTMVSAGNLNANEFSVELKNLVPRTTYYYKAYAKTASGTSYGNEESFTTGDLPDGLILYGVPVSRNGSFRFTLNNIAPGHYAVKIINMMGQRVYKKDYIVQVNFIDDTISTLGFLTPGVYTIQLDNYKGNIIRKQFMVH